MPLSNLFIVFPQGEDGNVIDDVQQFKAALLSEGLVTPDQVAAHQDEDGSNLLHFTSILKKCPNITAYLFERLLPKQIQLMLQMRDDVGYSPMDYVCTSGSMALLKRIVSEDTIMLAFTGRGEEGDGPTPFMAMCGKGDVDAMNHVLSNLTESNRSELINKKDRYGRTALHFAAGGCHGDAIKVLIESGANCLIRSCDGMTALHTSAEMKDDDSVKYLAIKFPELLLSKNEDDQTAVDLMEKHLYEEIAEMARNGDIKYQLDKNEIIEK